MIAQATVTILALTSTWSRTRVLRAAPIVMAGAWAVEALATATGFPFGHYTYTDSLQPQLAAVPLLIPLAWLMMLPPAWAVADAIAPAQSARRGLIVALISGLALTAWDLYLDPQMVARDLWRWASSGGYFGIPWVNFAGWFATAALLTVAVRPRDLPRRPLMAIYTLVWLFQAVGQGVLWGQPGPALAGFAGMGVFTAWSWRQELRR